MTSNAPDVLVSEPGAEDREQPTVHKWERVVHATNRPAVEMDGAEMARTW